MEETKIICGQCNIDIVESESTYIIKASEPDGVWFQCFDCYCAEEDSFYDDYDQNESYFDHYCRTSCSCCLGDEHHHWDEEE